MANAQDVLESAAFLTGGGEMGVLMRAHDWSTSPVGAPETWPQSLRSVVQLMLSNRQLMFVAWGPKLAFLYNDGYAPAFGRKHPWALGRPFREVWSEIWADIEPLVTAALAGETTFSENLHLVMERNGHPEDAWFTFSYSPLRDESGAVAGMFCAGIETTGQVLAERRIAAERDRQRRLFEQAPGFITILSGPELRFEFVNEAYDRLFGRRGFIGRTVREVFPDLEGQPFFDLLENAYATGERFVAHAIPISLQSTPGAEPAAHFLDFIYEPVRDDSGEVTGLFIEGHDVTDAHLARKALGESEARHRFRVELGDALRGLTTPSEIMAAVAERLGPRLGVDQANYYAIDGDRFVVTEEWRTAASHGMTGDHLLADFGEATIARIRAGEALRLDDTRIVEGAEAFAAVGIAAVLSVPLHQDGRWAAGLHVHQSQPRVWTDDEEALLREVASHVWSAVERVRAEATLRASEEFNRRVLASSSDCIKVLSLDGRLEFMSEGGMCVMEVDDFATIEGARWPDFWPGEGHAKALAAVEEANHGGAGRFQGFATTMKGSPRWWDVAVTPINGPNGTPERLLSVSRDVTEQRNAEARLRELNETLEQQVLARTAERDRMWETSPDLMLIIDFEGVFRRVNPAWAAVLGYTSEELVGRHVNEFVVPDDHGKTTDAYELAAAGGRPVIENRYRHKNGSIRWISWSAAPADELTYATGRDITLEQEREAELAQAQEALRQSQKMEAMGSLTGGVAHDFNNLLTPIIGSLDMLVRKGVGSERERRLIDGALQSAERAKTLVQRLLAFARRQPLQPVAVDVGRLVDGMTGLIGSTLGPTIDIRLDLDPDLPAAKADPNQLEMALLNLAVNARDAMPDGGEITIAAKRESVRSFHKAGVRPGHYVRLCFTDSGVGMDQETLARAIEPFFSTKGIGKGTGLGLSMVHGLAAQLGGGLTIDSIPGQGTSVELWLPISGTVAGEDEETAPAPPTRRGRGTALLVDDEALVRMSTADMLMDLGFEVVEAGSAEEALQLIEEGAAPDLLVTDHLMPGINGAELAHMLRGIQPALPVLVVSGYAEVDGLAPELPRLTKPFRNAELAASISALIPAVAQ